MQLNNGNWTTQQEAFAAARSMLDTVNTEMRKQGYCGGVLVCKTGRGEYTTMPRASLLRLPKSYRICGMVKEDGSTHLEQKPVKLN
jgi:hypothetical protein